MFTRVSTELVQSDANGRFSFSWGPGISAPPVAELSAKHEWRLVHRVLLVPGDEDLDLTIEPSH
jgi:hypothetical protein